MNYRHAYHAGNFADVHKHIVLVAVLLHLRRKEKPFALLDTHAGAGLYDLSGAEASKTREAVEGIAKLRGYKARTSVLQRYLEIVKTVGPEHYPGSPLIAAKLLRPQDRLVAIEKRPEEFDALKQSLVPFRNARAMAGDGYKGLEALLPPPERRGLVLIDPPYEKPDEWQRVSAALRVVHRRFAHGIALIWAPVKLASEVPSLVAEVQSAGPMNLLSLTIDVGVARSACAERLRTAGLLVLNPPFGLDHEMEAAGAEILPLLQQGSSARISVVWVSPRH